MIARKLRARIAVAHRDGGLWREVRRKCVPAAVAPVLVAGVAACGAQTVASTSRTEAAREGANGALTLLDGNSTTLAGFRGRPMMVWFVANGCASCAASIPAVAKHLPAFAHANTRVLVLGIYGAFGTGGQARAQLASFGREGAGAQFNDPAWTWGIASAALTTAYDPGGVPDEYFLLDRTGRIAYRGSVPVSTMGALLQHLRGTAA
jgi:hypothetical protein